MTRPTLLLACALFPSLNACAATPPGSAAPEQAMLGDQALHLEDQAGRCTLVHPAGRLELALPSPCEFHRNAEGAPRIEHQGAVPILLVQHSQPEAPPGQGCVTRLQAVRLRQGTLQASAPMTNASCPRGPWDQKLFTGPFDW